MMFAYIQVDTENEMEQSKSTMLVIATAGIDPGCMIYDKLMRGFIWKKYKVNIPQLKEEFANKCWGCWRNSEDIFQNEAKFEDTSKERSLKTCSRCGVAR